MTTKNNVIRASFTHSRAVKCRPVKVNHDDKARKIEVTRPDDERTSRSLHGLTRSLIANMVEGVVKGYEKRLKIEGIGYQARLDKKALELTVGYANKIVLPPPEGVTVECPDPTTIVVRGASTTAGPAMTLPGRSESASYSAVSTHSRLSGQ